MSADFPFDTFEKFKRAVKPRKGYAGCAMFFNTRDENGARVRDEMLCECDYCAWERSRHAQVPTSVRRADQPWAQRPRFELDPDVAQHPDLTRWVQAWQDSMDSDRVTRADAQEFRQVRFRARSEARKRNARQQ